MKVLFAVNLNEPAEAVRKVEELCNRLDAELYVLHVGALSEADLSSLDAGRYGAGLYPFAPGETEAAEQFGQVRKASFDHFIKKHFTRPVEAMLHESIDPAKMIVEDVERIGADMLVIAQKPHPFLERLVMGSVSSKLLKMVRVPTLLIPIGE